MTFKFHKILGDGGRCCFEAMAVNFSPNFAFLKEENDNLSETKIKRPINVRFSAIDHIC